MIENIDKIAGSAFVALVISIIGNVVQWRDGKEQRAEHRADSRDQWKLVGDLTGAQKDNNAITERALDAVERARA